VGRRRRDPDVCQICGVKPECAVRIHRDFPFIDGKCYGLMCFTCFSIPKKWEYDSVMDRVMCYSHYSPYYLHSVQEMVSDGWVKEEAEFSLKAVKRLLVGTLSIAKPIGGRHVFECLVLSSEVELVGWPDDKFSLKF